MSKSIVLLRSGHLEEKTHVDTPEMLEKDALLVYTGKFQSMDGEVEIKDEQLDHLAKTHNSVLCKFKRLAAGDVPAKSLPPIQLDHSTSARDTVGRLVGDLVVGDYDDEGSKKKALFGRVRILGKENVERVKDGRWTHLSIGADLEKGKLNELTITPFPAAPHAALLKRMAESSDLPLTTGTGEGSHSGRDSVTPQPPPSPQDQDFIDEVMSENYLTIAEKIRDGVYRYQDVEAALEVRDMTKLYAVEEVLGRWENRGVHVKGSHPLFWTRMKGHIEMPGKHIDEALWDKAKRAADEAGADDKYAFATYWYKKEGGKMSKMSKGEEMARKRYSEMDEKEKKMHHEKMKKHMKRAKKMSEEDAEKKMKHMSDEEHEKMSSEHDEDEKKMRHHLKHFHKMSDEEVEKKMCSMSDEEHEKYQGEEKAHEEMGRKMARSTVSTDLRAKNEKAIGLMKGIRSNLVSAQKEEKKIRLMGRFTRLRMEGKISPAEIKDIDIEKLCEKSQETLDAVIESYAKRQPVIMAGVYGSMKAEDMSKLAQRLKVKDLEEETLNNMPSLRMAKANEAKAKGTQMAGTEGYHADKESNVVGPVAGGATEKFSALHSEGLDHALAQYHKMKDEGKHDEALKHLREKLAQMWAADKINETVGPLSHGQDEHEKRMSALAESVKTIQNQSEDLIRLVSSELGLEESDLN